MTKVAILHSTLRKEEKLILGAARGRGISISLIDIRRTILAPGSPALECDVALERSVSTVKGFYAAAAFEARGIPVVNPTATARICGDKFLTSLRLQEAGVPVPRFLMAFDREQARAAVEMLGGFPVVAKPPQGSWGRLLARINDHDALDAVLEHKQVLGTPPQKAFYIQEYMEKPGYDIRAFMAGDDVLCAIARESDHWITNTALGGRARAYPVDSGLREICLRTSRALGGGLLAVDLFAAGGGRLVNEVNHTMEFRNSEEPTGVSISNAILDHCLRAARGEI